MTNMVDIKWSNDLSEKQKLRLLRYGGIIKLNCHISLKSLICTKVFICGA